MHLRMRRWVLLVMFTLAKKALVAGCGRPSSDASGAATAIDFPELMRRERARQRAALSQSKTTKRSLLAPRQRVDLERHVIDSAVGRIFYVAEFLSVEEADQLREATYRSSKKWRDLPRRRLQVHGGTPHPSGMVAEALPQHLEDVACALVEAGIFPEAGDPNHVLLNEYSMGQGLSPHKDGPLYDSQVAILSLGAPAFIHFWASQEEAYADYGSGQGTGSAEHAVASVLCESRSLLVFQGAAYTDLWHAVTSPISSSPEEEAEEARGVGEGGRPGDHGAETGTTDGWRGTEKVGEGPPVAVVAAATPGADGLRQGQEEPQGWEASMLGVARGKRGLEGGKLSPGRQARGGVLATRPRASETPVGPVAGREEGGRGAGTGAAGAATTRLSYTVRRVTLVQPGGDEAAIETVEAQKERQRKELGFERSVRDAAAGPSRGAPLAAPASAASLPGEGTAEGGHSVAATTSAAAAAADAAAVNTAAKGRRTP